MDEEAFRRFQECGCKVWYVDAEDLETGIKDLIAQERASPEFETLVRAEILERDRSRKDAAEAVAAAGEEVKRLERENTELARSSALSAKEGFEHFEQIFRQEIKPLQQQLAVARSTLAKAQRFADSREAICNEVSEIIHETRNVAQAWPNLSVEKRKALLDYWVSDVLIVVDPIPGMKRANKKWAEVVLRTTPEPVAFQLGDQILSADRNSPMTDSSDSTESREESSTEASGDPIRPSAQAACDRTTGSGSDRAEANVGTASAEPQLPSATQTLRANPARPTRRMADPLENESQEASSSAVSSSSINDGDSVPGCEDEEPGSGCTPKGGSPGGREAYAGSVEGFEKVRVNGHTS
jgi:hypothetical protein